jgi:hypothetical protein
VLRRIFGLKRDEIIGGWRKCHHKLSTSPDIIRIIKSRRIRCAGHVARMGRREMHTGFWWESQERERPLGRPRRRWEDNIKMDLREMGWSGMDWTDLAQDRDQWKALVNTVMNLRLP